MRNITGFANNRHFTFSTFSVQSKLPKELQFFFQVKKGPLAGAALSTPVAHAELSGYNYNGNPVHACGYRSMGLTVVLVISGLMCTASMISLFVSLMCL